MNLSHKLSEIHKELELARKNKPAIESEKRPFHVLYQELHKMLENLNININSFNEICENVNTCSNEILRRQTCDNLNVGQQSVRDVCELKSKVDNFFEINELFKCDEGYFEMEMPDQENLQKLREEVAKHDHFFYLFTEVLEKLKPLSLKNDGTRDQLSATTLNEEVNVSLVSSIGRSRFETSIVVTSSPIHSMEENKEYI